MGKKKPASNDSVARIYSFDKKKDLLGTGNFAEVFKGTLGQPRKFATAEDYARVAKTDDKGNTAFDYAAARSVRAVRVARLDAQPPPNRARRPPAARHRSARARR